MIGEHSNLQYFVGGVAISVTDVEHENGFQCMLVIWLPLSHVLGAIYLNRLRFMLYHLQNFVSLPFPC